MMTEPLTPPASLSVHRAFVVEVDAEADVQAGRVSGRVEHVVSGRATAFQSPERLRAFMAQVLRAVRDAAAQRARKETLGGRTTCTVFKSSS
jgi:hypothetical protein